PTMTTSNACPSRHHRSPHGVDTRVKRRQPGQPRRTRGARDASQPRAAGRLAAVIAYATADRRGYLVVIAAFVIGARSGVICVRDEHDHSAHLWSTADEEYDPTTAVAALRALGVDCCISGLLAPLL